MDKSRLYYQTPHMKSFMCIIEQYEKSGKGTWLAVLSQTGFYPEGGGQLSDTGMLNGVAALSVHEGRDMIIHELAVPLESGTLAEGIIDWQKRYDDMQQHTREYIPSGLIHGRFGYDNVGFHIGSEEVTVNFGSPITPEQLDQLENGASQAVYDNVPVKVLYPDKEELDSLDYKSKKKLVGPVRIVEISDTDMCACCGTYIEDIGEMGIIKIGSMIHYRDGVRTFLPCGRRALLDCRDRLRGETRFSNLLSARLGLVPEVVEKLKSDLQDRGMLVGRLYGQTFSLRTGRYPEKGALLALFGEGLNMVRIRQLSTSLYEGKRGGIVMVCSPDSGNKECQYILGNGCCDMRALSKAMNRWLSDRGDESVLMSQETLRADRQSVTKMFLGENALLVETGTQ